MYTNQRSGQDTAAWQQSSCRAPSCLSFVQKITAKLGSMSTGDERRNLKQEKITSNGSGKGDVTSKYKNNEELLVKHLNPLSLSTRVPGTRVSRADSFDDEPRSRKGSFRSPSPRQDERRRADENKDATTELAEHYRGMLECVGEDPERQGLLKTPFRAAKALMYFTKGYEEQISGKFNYSSL